MLALCLQDGTARCNASYRRYNGNKRVRVIECLPAENQSGARHQRPWCVLFDCWRRYGM